MQILYQTSDRNTFGVPDGQLMTFDASVQFITDRTQQDVAYVQQLASKLIARTATDFEKAEWNSILLKGAYNYTDLNRVGTIMQYIVNRLRSFGYSVVVSPKVDWIEADCPDVSDMYMYISDLTVLRRVLAVMKSTPQVPSSMDGLNYTVANNIEKILEDIDFLLTSASRAWYYSGDLFLGEV